MKRAHIYRAGFAPLPARPYSDVKKVAFEAQVKKIEHITLISNDKMTRITLQFGSDSMLEEINTLNALHSGGTTVAVAIAEIVKK